jgi:1,2-diacylglycerol 3-beta-galactosyltransferase
MALRTVEPGIGRLLDSLAPAAVVSFHPLLNHVAARAIARRTGPRIPFVTVITDLVDVHASWTCPAADAVVTPSPDGHAACLGAGIAADRCFELGLAVDRRFVTDAASDAGRAQLRASLGLDGDRVAVLLCGGAVGSGGLVSRARALAASDADIDLVVICGRNARAAAKLAGLQDARGRAVTVLGFVDNMADWMRGCDLLVTKAGPGAIAEALCSGIPLLLSSFLPGQERGNVDWVVRTGAGRYTPSVEGLVSAVTEISRGGPAGLAPMREAVLAAARPRATAEIADLVVRFADADR